MPNNPYLDMENRRTAGEAPEGAANNLYLSLANRLESAAVIRQQTTINKALMSNPEIEAEKRRLAGQLNLPPVAVDGLGMDEVKRRAALQQVQQNAANAPVLGRSLARDNFARLAIDDTSPLARIETALKDPVFRQGRAILEAQQRAIGGTLDAFRALQRPGALLKSLLAGTADLAAAAPGVARAGLEVAESYSRSAMPLIFSEKLTPEQIAQIRGERISAEKPFDPNAPLAVAAETARAGQEALRATGTRLMPTARTKGEEMVFGGVRSAGSSLGALLAGALTRSPGLAMEIMGSTAGAESYARGREKGLEPIEAAVYGWTSRNIEKVTELIPVKGLIDNLDAKTPLGTMLLDQLAREIPTEQAATVLGDLNDWVMTNPEGTLQEYLAERPSRALETLVSTVVATGLQTTIVKGADMARESLIQRVQQEKEVNQITTEGQLAVVEALMGEAANSKLAARDRDELQAFVDEAAADSPVTSIYIAPETLAQTAMDLNLDVRVVAEQLGVADQLMSSAQTGADIQLSVGAFIAKVSGTDLAAPLMNVIKTDPFLYSRAEMAQLKETGYANEVAEAEELVRTVLTDESFRASADVVRSQVTEQLQAMGRFTGDINTVYASATAQAYLTLAKRLNITPEEALARAPLKIRGQTITGQTPGVLQQPEVTLEQAQTQGYAGQDIGEAQEWVRARAKGLDMSQPARMERAKAMGFDTETVLYHGAVVWPTTAKPGTAPLGDVSAFDRLASTRTRKPSLDTLGVFLSDNPGNTGAGMYAGRGLEMDQPLRPAPVMYPLVVRANKTYATTFNEMARKAAELNNERGRPTNMEPYRKWLTSQGFDSVSFAKEPGEFADQNVLVVLDEANIRSVNAAFDPDFFESANILAQTVNAPRQLEDNPVAFGLTPEQAKKVNPIYNPKTLPVERLPSNQEAALWLEGNYIGDPVTDLTAELSDEQIKEIATIMAAEAQLALGNTGNAFTWYSSALAKALDIISIKYPMLADDAAAAEAGLGTSRNARFAFTYIMAVTSQNLDVAANSVATDKAFGDMLKRVANGNFTMPRSWGTGDKQKAMGENFAKFGPLIDKMPGDDFPSKLAALDDLFRVKMTVKEWVAYMKQQGVPYNKPGQTAMDAVVYGSSLLGPKIGNGFWQNLNGNYDPMTIDLWMRRTWGRLTGKSIGNPAALPEQRARLAGAIKRSRSREQGKPDHIAAMAAKIAATEKQLNGLKQADFASKKEFTAEEKRLKAEIKDNQEALADLANLKAPETWSAEYNTSNDALLAYAKRLLKAWNVEYERLKEGSKSGTVPAEAQPTWARAAKTIITNLAKPLDQVANGTQRKQIERAGKEALRILQERGITLTTADLQAILWYPEKELWGSLTAELETDEDGDPVVPPSSLNESYDTAFSRILKEQGYEIQGIAGDGGGGLGAGAVARQDGGPQQPASSGRVGAPGGAIAERGPDTLGQEQISGRRPQQLGARDGRRAYSSGGLAPLEGAPAKTAGPDPSLITVAEDYAAANGIPLRRPARFAELDVDRAQRIAAAFDAMQHAPNDPAVREAYENLKRQTRAQYDALIAAGYVFTFYDGDTDPYAGNPMNAMRDLRNNKRMAVYGTYSGYGTEGVTEGDRADNPMLEDAGLKWPDQNGAMQPVTANDLFRAVHDAFGHGLEAAGFRARGEENAWQAHMRLYTGSAVGAATTELRGQNSWLNYGPYGETNRTAKVEDTVFAENKIGLMPEWTWTEGRVEDMPEQPDTLGQAKRNLDALGFYSAVQEAAKLIPDNVWKMGWPAARSALAKGGAGIAPRKTELQYLNLDAMFGDTKLRGQALKEAVEEHIAANRLSLVENFARFDPNAKAPTKAEMLDQLSDWSLSNILNVRTINFGQNKGRIIAALLNRESEFQTGLFVEVGENEERVIDNRQYKLYRTLDNGQQELLFTGQLADIRRYAARVLVNENKALVLRNVTKDELEYYWEDERVEMGGLVRGPGDIRLPGEDVPLFEAVIGIPEGVPGADYRAPISHVGGKAKGTLVTAHGEERIDDKGQRTIFVGQVQSDMAQGKREEKKDLEASAKALRVLENNPNANLFLYTEGQIRVASAEDAADVPYAATLLSRDQVKEMYQTEGARIETPLLTTSEWTNVAVRAMIYRAAREGFESISFPTGETSAIIQGNDAAAQHYETNVKGALEKLAKQLGEEVRKGGVATNLDDVAEVNARAEEERLIQQTAENMGIPEEEFANFRKELIEEGQFYDRALSEERAKAQMASAYILDLTPAMREKIMSEGFPLFQERRGEYAPALNEIRINAQADLSTYIHELGHHFLEVYNNVALELVASQVGGQDLAEQEQVLVNDTRRLITEIARQTNTPIDGDALTWWNGLTFQQRVPMHEQFARLTEAYFMTGEAPTPELKDIFSTIRRWMLQVYKSLTELNVELSDEVKEVMGRMYAAQDDIATAERNRGLNRLFSVKPDYMSDQEWQAYQQIAAQATSDAEDELSARSVRDVQWLASARSRELRKLQRANADKRNLMKAEVSLEVMQMPVNRARSFLKRGVGPNDEPVTGPHKLSIAIMESRYPQQADTDPARRWKRLGYGQYGMLAETGLDPDTVAELTGFPSGDALVEALLTAERASTVIDAETDRRMLERYGDLSDEQKMSQAADEAVHNGLRARVLQAEYAALSKAAKRTRPLVMAAKEIAQAQVAKMQASKLNANKFIAAERAAGKKAEAALRKSDLTGAATAKRDQLLNFEIAREIQRVIKQRDRMLTLFKTIVTAKRDTVSKTRNYDLVQASRAVLSAYGFGRVKNDVNSYLEAIKVYDPTLYSNLAPTITNAVSRGMTMDQLSVEQFLGMGDVVKQLWDLSREEMVVEIDGRKLELAAVTQELGLKLESLGAAPKGASTEAASDWQKTLRQGEGLKSSLRRVEAWARLYDGTKVGPFTKYIWRTISTAADRYRADRNKYVQQFRDLFATIEGGMGGKKINAPEINYTFRTKSELLHAILHTGNGSNKRKLLLGRQWGEVDQDGALIDNRWQNLINRLAQEGVLTKADFDFAQGVWDLLEETKPLAQETHRKVFGLYFSEITAEEVQTPFGTYRGGYVPAVYDSYNVQDAALRAQQEQVEANDSTMFPAPASGFTKNRVEYNRELALDLMILPNHIDKVLKFSHMASPVRDVMKILKNKEFSALLEAIDPTAQSDVLLPWLTRAARQIVEEPTKGQGGPMVDGFFRAIRQRSGMGLMFANLVNVAQQVTGFSLAAIVVKPSYLARGLLRYTSNPQKITETIRQASMMMRERGDNQLSAMYGEIDKIIDKDDKYGQVKDWFGRHTYFMQQGVQNVMDVIVWLGAYDQALAAGETENEAAKQGDAAVRMTQGSTLPEDVSRIETGPAVLRSFTHMYSYFNMWGNLLSAEFRTTWRELGLKQGAGRLMFAYMAGLAIPTFFAQIIADGLRGKLPEDEDEDGWMDEWLSWAFMTSSKTALAFIPVAGQAGVATIGAFTNEPYDDRVGGSPAISAVEASVRTPASVYKAIAEDGDKSRAVKDTLTLLTTLTGLPFQVLGRPVGYAVDVAEGDITPTSGADYVRGLVTGAASEASR